MSTSLPVASQSWSAPAIIVLADWHCYVCNKGVSATKSCPMCNAPEPPPDPQPEQQYPLLDASGEYMPTPDPFGQALSTWVCPTCKTAVEDSKVCGCGQPEPEPEPEPLHRLLVAPYAERWLRFNPSASSPGIRERSHPQLSCFADTHDIDYM